MTGTRPAPTLTKYQRGHLADLNSEKEQQHAENRARNSKRVHGLKRRGPSQFLAVLNAQGPSPSLLKAMQRLSGQPQTATFYDDKLVALAWLFCRAFALLGMRLPRLRGRGRPAALDAAVTGRRTFRKIRGDAASGVRTLTPRDRLATVYLGRDLEILCEWLMTVDEAWLARLRRCRGCLKYFWQETIGTPKEHHAAGCRVKALRARRRASSTPVTTY